MGKGDGEIGGGIVERSDALAAVIEHESHYRQLAQFRQLAENIHQAFWVVSPDWREVIYVSPAYEKVRGRPREELYREPLSWFEGIHPEDRATIAHELDRRSTGEICDPRLPEYRIVRPDGEIRWVSARAFAFRDETDKVVSIAGYSEDITDRKRREEAVRESETRFRATFEQAAVGMAHVGLDGRFLRINQKLCEITGYSRAELELLTFQDITHPEDLAADLSQAQALRDGEIAQYTMEKRYVRPDGSFVWANMTGSLVRDGEGRPQYYVAVVEDIERRKAAEEQQILMISESRHRIKNILATVQAVMSQTLRHVDSLEDFEERFSGRVKALARGNDLLLQRSEKVTDLSSLLRHALEPYQGADRISIDGDRIRLDTDMAMGLNLILHELATNAAKYGALSAEGGRVRVDCRMPKDDPGIAVCRWAETGGPLVRPPKKQGFGSKLIESSSRHTLRGEATFDYLPGGLECTIRFPVIDDMSA